MAAIIAAAAYIPTLRATADAFRGTIVSLLVAGLCYGCALLLLDGRRLFGDIQQIRAALFVR